jgi:hypothetical protein
MDEAHEHLHMSTHMHAGFQSAGHGPAAVPNGPSGELVWHLITLQESTHDHGHIRPDVELIDAL